MSTQTSTQAGVEPISPFPDEVFAAILEHLSPIDLSRVAQSNKTLYRVATSPYLWEKAYFSFWHEEDFDQAERRQTVGWRNAKRLQNLYRTAKEVWKVNRSTNKNTIDFDRDEIPFPTYLSSDSARFAKLSNLPSPPNFYILFCERMKIDKELLSILKDQCFDSQGWLHRILDVVKKYGDDIKDVLQALVVVQRRIGPTGSAFIQSEEEELQKDKSDFPSALQLRLPSTYRSKNYHLTLLHLAEDLLIHLRSRQAMYGMSHLRAQHDNQPWKHLFPWLITSSVHPQEDNEEILKCVQKAKEFENSLCLLSMFRGGEGQEISDELDMLAVSCALYLDRNGIRKEDDVRKFAVGICKFMGSRGFKGASDASFYNLDNSFIHLCLDESGRESLPLTLVVIFCALSNRLGLTAFPTNTPARLLAIVNVSLKSKDQENRDEEKQGNDCFWISVADDGLLYELNNLQNMLGLRSLQANSTFVNFSTPIECCSRAANNIINSVQRWQVLPTLTPDSNREQYEEVDEDRIATSSSNNATEKVDQLFEWSMMNPENVFNPRKTYLHTNNQEEYLISPFWFKEPRTKRLIKKASKPSSPRLKPFYATSGRFQRVHHWSYPVQTLSMLAAANARIRFGEQINDTGLRWLLASSSDLFPQNILTIYQEFFPVPTQSRFPSHTNISYLEFFPDPKQSRLPSHTNVRADLDLVKREYDRSMEEDRKAPLAQRRISNLRNSINDQENIKNIRNQTYNSIHPIGTVFVHRNYRYSAVIRSWDKECTAGEDWIQNMNVDKLPNGGRHQPFYLSMVSDGSTRYVAHCNILPASWNTSNSNNQGEEYDLLLSSDQIETLFRIPKIGTTFRCAIAQTNGRGLRFLPNKRGQSEFPDDDEHYKKQINTSFINS